MFSLLSSKLHKHRWEYTHCTTKQLFLELLMMVTNRLASLPTGVFTECCVKDFVPVYVSYFLSECSLVKFKTISD